MSDIYITTLSAPSPACRPVAIVERKRPGRPDTIYDALAEERSRTLCRFYLGKRCVEVVDVPDRWLDPAHRYFKLRGDDNGIYILRYSNREDSWETMLSNSRTTDRSRLSSTWVMVGNSETT